MGSFVGHLVPGIIGLLFCMRTLYNVLLRFYHCDKYSRVMAVDSEDAMRYRFRSSLTYKTFFCSNLPLEEFVIIAAAVIGTAAELISKLHYADPFVSVGGQHLTIFLFFGFAAVISTMKFYGVPVPTDCEYACAALAFGLEGFLLYHHAFFIY
ncbi:transmembrane protein 45A-like [Hyalella azteca]|uniref:Transmembrane protein 45A-like n=1 Tax=Hyalella azteca TaxID=294128 RepID=A0A8B7N2Q5_HYAAZ|nr:transmembrane protein 45A-like [Hyalella azteca]